MEEKDRALELAHLEHIEYKIKEQLKDDTENLKNQREELMKQRKQMWQEGAHGVADFDDIVDMASFDAMVREEHGHYIRKDEQVRRMNYLLNSPYFGRIDFREDGEEDAQPIYIGRYCYCNEEHQYEIYDWRSPIASMFYDADQGCASYHCPAGTISGNLTCKCQYRIENGELKYFYEADQTVQDEMLGQVLAENTDQNLRVIIDTITGEQNQAIRMSGYQNMLIQGPAGSGKTSVGMHRLAYLLYHDSDQLSSDKIVILSKNEIFSHYIGQILPELGEEEALNIIFDDLIRPGMPRQYHKNWYYDQMEYLLTNDFKSIRSRGIQLKESVDFLNFLRQKVPQIIKQGKKVDVVPFYLHLLGKYLREAGMNDTIYYQTKHLIEQMNLNYEDMIVIQVIRLLTHQLKPNEIVRQVVIDEAQDYSPIQLFLIRNLYPNSHFTILMDPNQVIHPAVSTTNMLIYQTMFGEKLNITQLHKSYRSTAQINAFAFSVLGIEDENLYIDRKGNVPKCFFVEKMSETIEILLKQAKEKNQLVGILVPDRRAAKQLKHSLHENQDVQFIHSTDDVMKKSAVLIPIALAKGLEFDVVIVCDPYDTLNEQSNMIYLMATRALHELYFIKSTQQSGIFLEDNKHIEKI